MTGEPDSKPPRRPPTIDLSATEVSADPPSDSGPQAGAEIPQAAPAEPAPDSSRQHVISALGGGVVGAAAIAAIIVALQATGHWPVHFGTAPVTSTQSSVSNDAAIAEVTAQIKQIQSTLAAQKADPALVSRLAAVEATTKSLGDSLNAQTGRIDQAAATAQGAQAQAKTTADAVSAAKTATQSGVSQSDLDGLAGRVAALESAVKSLSDTVSHQAAGADDGAARLMVVTEALRAAVERGIPFQAELAAAQSLGADQTTLAALAPFAASGVPSAATLARELATLTPALTEAAEPKSALKSTQNTFLDRIEINAQRLVRSSPIDAPAGDDPRSIAMRVNFDATHGDIDAALADIAKLPDAAKAVVAPWVQKVQTRNAAVAASLKLTANALAALGKPQ